MKIVFGRFMEKDGAHWFITEPQDAPYWVSMYRCAEALRRVMKGETGRGWAQRSPSGCDGRNLL